MSERPLPRRAFLGYAGLGVSAVWMPSWLARSFSAARTGQEPSSEDQRDEEPIPPLDVVLKEAFERARGVGKPLLVFVVPAELDEVWKRQHLLGQYLNMCSPEALADLALCECACARPADIAIVFPDVPEVRGEPLMVLVESGPVTSVLQLDAELPELVVRWGRTQAENDRAEKEFENLALHRVERIGELVKKAVAIDRPMLEQRAVQVRAALTEEVDTLVEQALRAPDAMPLDTIDRLAALLRIAAEDHLERRETCIDAIARSARERLRTGPPAGAWWAKNVSCGAHELEGHREEATFYACGMGRIPEASRRFLHFYTTQCAW